MKKYIYSTYNAFNEDVETYFTECVNAKQARREAKKRVANSMKNEVRHGRIKLANNQTPFGA